MPDISMCINPNCSLSSHCYRFMATPDQWQSFLILDQTVKTEEDCEHFWRMKEDETSIVELQTSD